MDELPSVLLGMRSVYKEDIGAKMAELVYGETIIIPGEFFETCKQQSTTEFDKELHRSFDRIRTVPTSNHSTSTVFVRKELKNCSHVFVRHDAVRTSLQKPYNGSIFGNSSNKQIKNKNKEKIVNIDRLKQAFGVVDTNPTPVLTNSHKTSQDKPKINNSQNESPLYRLQTTTRSGRKVHFPERFVIFFH